MDRVTKETRSAIMSRIKSKDTYPELLIRRELFSLGYRFRKHYRIGKHVVDIAFVSKKKAIQVNGCFWHGHANCKYAHIPKTRTAYWEEKIKRNRNRDIFVEQELIGHGWRIDYVWECETKDIRASLDKLCRFLED